MTDDTAVKKWCVKKRNMIAVAIVTCNICRWFWLAGMQQGVEFGAGRRRVPSYPVSTSGGIGIGEWSQVRNGNGGMELWNGIGAECGMGME